VPEAAATIARASMRRFLAITGLLLLGWQATMTAVAFARGLATQAGVPWQRRLLATTDDRVRMALGADADILFALRAASEPGDVLIAAKVMGRIEDLESPADFERLAARNGLLVQLTTLLYPDPFLLTVPDAIAAVRDLSERGDPATLCVFPGDPTPDAGGWSRTATDPHFELWRFRKG
jgi:hypothetical protein